MKRVLVTGASGFLGKYIISELTRLNFNFDTLGRDSTSTISADISKTIPVLSQEYDLVIHAAGKAHSIPTNDKEREEFYNINYYGTENLLSALVHKPQFIVFISTVSVYGLDSGYNISEDVELLATDAYGKSKIKAEEAIREWGKNHGVIVTILRLPLLLGATPQGNLKSMIHALERGYYFNIGKGNAQKSMVCAYDVAVFIPSIMKIGGTYNLTDGYHPTFYELSEKITEFLGLKKPISIPYYFALFGAYIGDIIQIITGRRLPLNKRQLIKLTKPLTFNDKKARTCGWNPKEVISHPAYWLEK
ncbi:nucleoside-diphosphate-sugar epimerase [Winogradskyella wandonensis]|uniref:Nucleoside-diphosphate-sugar epimerase n=1 Tax=Winogradskyella wandonensis TaxID=1442586 RepID=A0A4R1KU85_9FLAO|nr:NAD-dependent epimerase/dehydratase family protein [Winogradskyella wandonensis]TCK67799.1 nucleoside-diphosphate-sugar epimerase [Winogradskyella wandonensis]